jgi:hypothetical protein
VPGLYDISGSTPFVFIVTHMFADAYVCLFLLVVPDCSFAWWLAAPGG